MTDTTLTIRQADVADAPALARLAALDSSSPPTGEALVAVVDGELWAAIELDTGTTIADPFRPSGELATLLRFRSKGLRREARGRSPLARLLPRTA